MYFLNLSLFLQFFGRNLQDLKSRLPVGFAIFAVKESTKPT